MGGWRDVRRPARPSRLDRSGSPAHRRPVGGDADGRRWAADAGKGADCSGRQAQITTALRHDRTPLVPLLEKHPTVKKARQSSQESGAPQRPPHRHHSNQRAHPETKNNQNCTTQTQHKDLRKRQTHSLFDTAT